MIDSVIFRSTTRVGWRESSLWGVILLIAVAVRLYQLNGNAFWYDEAFSWVMSSHAPGTIWSISATDVHPPLYYLVLKGWIALFGDSLTSLRGLSVFASVVATALGVWLTCLLATRRAACIAAILLVLLPIAVRYSHEVRMYALLSVWMTGATLALVYWVMTPSRQAVLAAYALLITAGLYTHYFAVVGVMVHWLFLLVSRNLAGDDGPRLILRPAWWIANLAAALLFLPWLPMFVAQLGQSSNLGWIGPVTLDSIPSVFWQYLTLDNGAELPAAVRWALVMAIAAVCVWCVKRDRQPQRLSLLLVVYLWAPLLVVFLVSLQFPLFVARYFLFSALGLPMLLGIALDGLAGDHRRLAVLGLMALIACEVLGLRNLYGEYDTTNADGRKTRERINLIAELIERRYQPGDQVIVLNYFWYPSLVYYGTGPVKPLLYAPVASDGGDVCRVYCRFKAPYGAARDDFYIQRLDRLPTETLRVWLVDGIDATDFQLSLPCNWRRVDSLVRGDNRLRLYDVGVGPAGKNASPCPTP